MEGFWREFQLCYLNLLADLGGFIRSFTFLGLNFLELAGLVVTLHFIVIQVGIWLEYFWSDFICLWFGLLTDLRKLGKWAGEANSVSYAFLMESCLTLPYMAST